MTQKVLARIREGEPPADPLDLLTPQESRILELIGEGMTNRQIADEMFLAEKTVKNYVTHLLAKLGTQAPHPGRRPRSEASPVLGRRHGRPDTLGS